MNGIGKSLFPLATPAKLQLSKGGEKTTLKKDNSASLPIACSCTSTHLSCVHKDNKLTG